MAINFMQASRALSNHATRRNGGLISSASSRVALKALLYIGFWLADPQILIEGGTVHGYITASLNLDFMSCSRSEMLET